MSGLITVKIDYSKEIDHVRIDIDSKEIDHVRMDIDSKEIVSGLILIVKHSWNRAFLIELYLDCYRCERTRWSRTFSIYI